MAMVKGQGSFPDSSLEKRPGLLPSSTGATSPPPLLPALLPQSTFWDPLEPSGSRVSAPAEDDSTWHLDCSLLLSTALQGHAV